MLLSQTKRWIQGAETVLQCQKTSHQLTTWLRNSTRSQVCTWEGRLGLHRCKAVILRNKHWRNCKTSSNGWSSRTASRSTSSFESYSSNGTRQAICKDLNSSSSISSQPTTSRTHSNVGWATLRLVLLSHLRLQEHLLMLRFPRQRPASSRRPPRSTTSSTKIEQACKTWSKTRTCSSRSRVLRTREIVGSIRYLCLTRCCSSSLWSLPAASRILTLCR